MCRWTACIFQSHFLLGSNVVGFRPYFVELLMGVLYPYAGLAPNKSNSRNPIPYLSLQRPFPLQLTLLAFSVAYGGFQGWFSWIGSKNQRRVIKACEAYRAMQSELLGWDCSPKASGISQPTTVYCRTAKLGTFVTIWLLKYVQWSTIQSI